MKAIVRYSLCALALAAVMAAPAKAQDIYDDTFLPGCEEEMMEALYNPPTYCQGGGGGGGGSYTPPAPYQPPQPTATPETLDFKGRKINKKAEVTGNFTAELQEQLTTAATDFIKGLFK